MAEKCAECEVELTDANIVKITDDFAVCKPCNDEVNAGWKIDKQMLKEQGFDPDCCPFIEDVVTAADRKAHRMFCSVCGEVIRVMFHVPNDIWELSVHISQIENLICLRCFTRMADERGVEWDREITFEPISQVKHSRTS